MYRSRGKASDLQAANSQNPHLSSDRILLLLDGELSSRETAQAKTHLEACWSCRVRSEQIGEVIADVVTYHDCFLKSSLPLSTDTRATFLMQLRQLVRNVGEPSIARRVLDLFREFRSFWQGEFVPRHAWISGIIIGAFTLFSLVRFYEVPRVSASQFLTNAQASEIRALHGIAKPVVYQKINIRLGNRAVARTIYRDLAGNRQVDYVDSGAGDVVNSRGFTRRADVLNSSQRLDAEFEQTFQKTHLNWEDPLSPTSYSAWHDSLSQKQDDVTQVSHEFLTLKTTTAEGPIKEATITLRTSDFHPVAEGFYLNDSQQVEITELAWQVTSIEAIDSAIFASERVPSPAIVRPTLRIPVGPTDVELAEAELRARIALHAEGADLGEQIEFDPSASDFARRFLVIRGIVNTPERKAELSVALEGIPHVELELQTIQEAAIQNEVLVGNKSGTETQQIEAPDFTPERSAGEPDSKTAVEGHLEERFPNPQERLHFVNSAVNLAQDCLLRAWALRRLQDHYTADEVALLGPESRQTLELLIRDDASALRQRVDALRDLVFPVLSESTASAEPTPTTEAPPTAANAVDDWRSSITEIFPKVQNIEIQVVALVGGRREAVSDWQDGVHELRSALAELELQLPVLDQRMSVGFLSDQERTWGCVLVPRPGGTGRCSR